MQMLHSQPKRFGRRFDPYSAVALLLIVRVLDVFVAYVSAGGFAIILMWWCAQAMWHTAFS